VCAWWPALRLIRPERVTILGSAWEGGARLLELLGPLAMVAQGHPRLADLELDIRLGAGEHRRDVTTVFIQQAAAA
jgi:hypothetical protein